MSHEDWRKPVSCICMFLLPFCHTCNDNFLIKKHSVYAILFIFIRWPLSAVLSRDSCEWQEATTSEWFDHCRGRNYLYDGLVSEVGSATQQTSDHGRRGVRKVSSYKSSAQQITQSYNCWFSKICSSILNGKSHCRFITFVWVFFFRNLQKKFK